MSKPRPWRRKPSSPPSESTVETASVPAGTASTETPAEPESTAEDAADDAADETSDETSDGTTDDTTDATTDADAGSSTARDGQGATTTRRRRLRDWTPLLLARAAHPRQLILTAAGMTLAAALDGRPSRELGLIAATVVVGQAILGWHNDLVDEAVDRAHQRRGKPVADGRLEAGAVWFALCCAVLLVVPLAVSNGIVAGLCYLVSVVVGMLGNVVLRKGLLSFVPWAVAFGLYPAFLSYGGWGGDAKGDPPQTAMIVLAALLGVGVHFLLALWGLVADNADGWTYPPLKLGLRLGATKLLIATLVYLALVVAGLLYAGHQVGLSR